MELLHAYREILGVFDIIILTSIIILSISLYVSYKKINFISNALIYFLQVIVITYIDYYNFMNNLNITILNILFLILITRYFILISFTKNTANKKYIITCLTIAIVIENLILKVDYSLFIIVNIFLNIAMINFTYTKSIKIINSKFEKNKYILNQNRQFISKSIKEIESEANINYTLKKSINNLNHKIESIVKLSHTPIFILNDKNEYIYGNKQFIKFLERNKLNIKQNEVLNLNKDNNDLIELKSNQNIYKFKYNKDIFEENQIKICVLIKNEAQLKKSKYKSKLITEEYKDIYNNLLQTLPEGIAIINKNNKIHKFRNKSMIKILKSIGIENFNEIINDYISKGRNGISKTYTIKSEKNIKLNLIIKDFIDEDSFICYINILSNIRGNKKLNEVKNMYNFKNEFLYAIYENLKQPINTIFESNKRIQCNESKQKYTYIDNYSRVIKQNSYRLKRLLDNIEEINKIENGVATINYTNCDIIKFTQSIVNICKEYAKLKNIEIIFKSNIKKMIISIDQLKIERMILNLLSNAIKFTNEGGKIIVSVNVDENESIISVEDTGVGIKEENLEIIFDNFVQLDTTLHRASEGTGIGLALVKNIAKLHDSKINVYSKLGEGSKFEISLKNLSQKGRKKQKKIKYNFNELVDIEFSDIYFNLDI